MSIIPISRKTRFPKILSKKIHKYAKFIRKPFKEDSISTCDMGSISEMNIDDDKFDSETISYTNSITGKAYYFACYNEKDLKTPEEYKKSRVELTCDDDCKTDDEQIKSAIKKLYGSLEECANSRRNLEN